MRGGLFLGALVVTGPVVFAASGSPVAVVGCTLAVLVVGMAWVRTPAGGRPVRRPLPVAAGPTPDGDREVPGAAAGERDIEERPEAVVEVADGVVVEVAPNRTDVRKELER